MKRGIAVWLVLVVLLVGALVLAAPQPLKVDDLLLGGAAGAAVIAVGLLAAGRFGKGAPLVARWVAGEGRSSDVALLLLLLLAGAAIGAALLSLIIFVVAPIEPAIGARLAARAADPIWRPLVLSVESSVLEEFAFRLFLMSAVAWIAAGAWRREARPTPFAVLLAALISAAAFGAIHLPPWIAAVTHPGPVLLASVLALNGVVGVAFGTIYWRWGIESAIAAHFAGDFVLQTLGPRLLAG